jgi:hypothetical protein
VTHHGSSRHSPYPSHSASPIGPLSRSPLDQSTSMLQKTSETPSMENLRSLSAPPGSSRFNSAADASQEMDIDTSNAISKPQSVRGSQDLICDPATPKSGIVLTFLPLLSFKIIPYSSSKQ